MSFPKFHTSTISVILVMALCNLLAVGAPATPAPAAPPVKEAKPKAASVPAETKPTPPKPDGKAPVTPPKESKPSPAPNPAPTPADAVKPAPNPASPPAAEDGDDEAAAENADAEKAAVAKPVGADPVQIFGWRENVLINGVQEKLKAKLDTGALTSSIHAEEKELFERDGKKWVRFIVTDPSLKKPVRTRIEAPLLRIAHIKEPGGQSTSREVVRLAFQIGERKMRGEFTLNNRSNMLAPVLIGRNMIKDLGWVDPTRVHLAEQKIFR